MRSATSFFDKTTARSDLRRHWPIAFIYTCVWLVGLPVNLWSSSMWMPEEMTPALRAAQIIIGSYPTLAGALFVFGCVLAMALMGYLMSPRAVGLLHALPVRRGTLLATHTLVGWLMLNVPALLAVLVSIPVQAYYGGVAWGALGAWLLVHCGLSLFFLALGLLCAMVTGWLLAIPAIYAVVNFAVIAAAGHQIALHSATHQYSKIYASTDAFWQDIRTLRQALEPYVDVAAIDWLRFPGGSTNTVSHRYGGNGIMKALKAQAEDKGYHWIDWNVCAEDATASHPDAAQILRNIRRDADGQDTCVVLLHDTKATGQTVKALPDMIAYFREQGYNFCTIAQMNALQCETK